jgi:hypothetical protein
VCESVCECQGLCVYECVGCVSVFERVCVRVCVCVVFECVCECV